MKNKIFMAVKKLANRAGYDIKYYHPYYEALLKNQDIKTVLDIGANTGQFARDIHNRLPKAQIYSFEPLKDGFDLLMKNMADVADFKAFNVALGETTGKMQINRSAFSPSSSMLKMAELHKKLYPKSAESAKEEITVKRLDDMAEEFHIKKPLLIKVDVQGYEDKVIAGGKNIFGQASVVVIETSFVKLYEGQPLFGDIHDQLRALGFSYHGNKEQHWNEKTGEPIYEDSIFVK
jgi:FkbM family methyltransferase